MEAFNSFFLGMGKQAKARRAIRTERKQLRNDLKKAKVQNKLAAVQQKQADTATSVAQANLVQSLAAPAAEPAKKKPNYALIGGIAAGVILLAVIAWLALRKS